MSLLSKVTLTLRSTRHGTGSFRMFDGRCFRFQTMRLWTPASCSDCGTNRRNGQGVLLYMRQEGRGIGLVNKFKAYKLQEEGLDTVEANLRLGFGEDLREYGIGAQILQDLGVGKMRLLTNNPRKIKGLKGYGLEVTEVVPLEIPANKNNRRYMETKKEKLGHMLHL